LGGVLAVGDVSDVVDLVFGSPVQRTRDAISAGSACSAVRSVTSEAASASWPRHVGMGDDEHAGTVFRCGNQGFDTS
jgi:hypothetical protein